MKMSRLLLIFIQAKKQNNKKENKQRTPTKITGYKCYMAIQMKLKGVINQHECGHVEPNIGFHFFTY